ncbi:MAG: isoprenylcysteine carboxylmethyltransferase family protein [Spirochaetes bacterium]|nr:isoprenylcysteine carboxylmethyltransferase family protein [Spirochaetota bacterium]
MTDGNVEKIKSLPQHIFRGLLSTVLIILVPLLGNHAAYRASVVWVVFILVLAAQLLQPHYQLAVNRSNRHDKGTEAQIIWSVGIMQALAMCEASYLRYATIFSWDAVRIIALCAAAAGLALRTWAVTALGSYFTMQLHIQNSHTVITAGPYRYLRHPSYAGAFLIFIGIPVALHAWYAAAAALIILPAAWARRIFHEEQMLRETLGTHYTEYCARVKRIIPGIW